jgi:hypothetical protein
LPENYILKMFLNLSKEKLEKDSSEKNFNNR